MGTQREFDAVELHRVGTGGIGVRLAAGHADAGGVGPPVGKVAGRLDRVVGARRDIEVELDSPARQGSDGRDDHR